MFNEFDHERRRIEGALHDGVQQDLIAASVRLQLALDVLDRDPAAARMLLEELDHQVEEALERVRTLAHEIYPSILPARGLGDALRAAGIEVGSIGRYALEVEEAVYFACQALLPGARLVRVWVEEGAVRFEAWGVFDEAALTHANARVTGAGGQLAASSGCPGVTATVPVSASAR